LGGHLVLLKAVLETQPVYWLALAHVTISVLNTIRKIFFAFPWSGVKNKKKFHLCNWMSIARPKSYGGWGLVQYLVFQQIFGNKYDVASYYEDMDLEKVF
jgi:hypothetical protein